MFAYNMYLNITEGSPLLELDDNDTITWFIYYDVDYHSRDLYTDQPYKHQYYQTQFGIKLPGMEVSATINLNGPIEEAFPLTSKYIEQCSWGKSTFIKVPAEVYLLSSYLYHLGTSLVYSYISVLKHRENYYHSRYFYGYLSVVTNAGEEFLQL